MPFHQMHCTPGNDFRHLQDVEPMSLPVVMSLLEQLPRDITCVSPDIIRFLGDRSTSHYVN